MIWRRIKDSRHDSFIIQSKAEYEFVMKVIQSLRCEPSAWRIVRKKGSPFTEADVSNWGKEGNVDFKIEIGAHVQIASKGYIYSPYHIPMLAWQKRVVRKWVKEITTKSEADFLLGTIKL